MGRTRIEQRPDDERRTRRTHSLTGFTLLGQVSCDDPQCARTTNHDNNNNNNQPVTGSKASIFRVSEMKIAFRSLAADGSTDQSATMTEFSKGPCRNVAIHAALAGFGSRFVCHQPLPIAHRISHVPSALYRCGCV